MNATTLEPSAVVLHELRAPLGFLVTAARAAAQECPEDGPMLAHVRVLEKAAMRLLASAEQVLTVALAEHEREDEPFKPDAVAAAAVEEAIAIGQPLRLKRSGDCRWTSERGNPAQLVALLQSLINNALQHGPRNAEPEIRIRGTARSFELEVRNGVCERTRPGLGVGSKVCQELATRLGGSLSTTTVGNDYVVRFSLRRETPRCATRSLAGQGGNAGHDIGG